MTRPKDRGDQYPSDIGDQVPVSPTTGYTEQDYRVRSPYARTIRPPQDFAPDPNKPHIPEIKRQVYAGYVLGKLPGEEQPEGLQRKYYVMRHDGLKITAITFGQYTPLSDYAFSDEVILVEGEIQDKWYLVGRKTPTPMAYKELTSTEDQVLSAAGNVLFQSTTLESPLDTDTLYAQNDGITVSEDGAYDVRVQLLFEQNVVGGVFWVWTTTTIPARTTNTQRSALCRRVKREVGSNDTLTWSYLMDGSNYVTVRVFNGFPSPVPAGRHILVAPNDVGSYDVVGIPCASDAELPS